jgi:hypothetical protein
VSSKGSRKRRVFFSVEVGRYTTVGSGEMTSIESSCEFPFGHLAAPIIRDPGHTDNRVSFVTLAASTLKELHVISEFRITPGVTSTCHTMNQKILGARRTSTNE